MVRPTIGDFRSPDQNKPRVPPTPSSPEKVSSPTSETSVNTEPTSQDPDFLTPAEKYRKQLEAAKIDLKEAEGIYDAVLTKGYYEEYVRLRGTHRAVFRTRAYEDHLRLQTVLEMQKPQLAISQDELITRYNLAASLFEWDGKVLKHETEEDFDTLLLLLRKLPGPIFSVLARELSKFDAKIMAVFDAGAAENF